jgi:hypothetical protein
MTLREKQSKFVHLVGLLIVYAYEHGYELTFGDAWSKPEYKAHSDVSFHYKRLAIDLNLFRDGRYLTMTEDWEPLGQYWKSLDHHASWGGDWSDGNHLSYGEGR